MPSEIATKIAAAYYKEIPREEKCAAMLASFLDSCGVGDAFACCNLVDCGSCDLTNKMTDAAVSALRKAGLV